MPPIYPALEHYKLVTGDARSLLRLMPDKSVNCVVTSPPYYGLRSYQTDPQVWGGDRSCEHEFVEDLCRCGAWRGELGHERTPDLFVEHLVEIFREVKRVLRDDGTAFVNMGDSYIHGNRTVKMDTKSMPPAKNMLAVPWRLGLALQADGWFLRQDVIWSKAGGNCPKCHYRLEKGSAMPEPVRDRFVRAHEYVLFITKKPEKYYFDYVAIQQDGANRRDVLFLTGTPYHAIDGNNEKQHYAVMSEKLAEVCVLAGTPEKTCAACGAPWTRIIEGKSETKAERLSRIGAKAQTTVAPRHDGGVLQQGLHIGKFPKVTLGWQPTCKCEAGHLPGLVMDPFSGTGTTGAVGIRHGRRYYGIDIDAAMIPVATGRLDTEVLGRTPPSDIRWLTDEDDNCIEQ